MKFLGGGQRRLGGRGNILTSKGGGASSQVDGQPLHFVDAPGDQGG